MEAIVEVPEEVSVALDGNRVHAKGPKGELQRTFANPLVTLELRGRVFRITSRDDRRRTRALVGTWCAHLHNMFAGVTQGFERRMKIVHVHFPMSVKVEGHRLVMQNLLGQKSPRYAAIEEGVEVKIEGDEIVLKGIDADMVGQTASNIEAATLLANRRDRRRFYDGIYLRA